ncbi:hypothetical protein [Neobacillus ginsengisoli]|uniref:Uncharacterized protein n=1 Tax=Neobacillus ginsengisoli TaxID=904295 RepID=A0ABT9Y064_9BACI|nr:hypothetical protein [Neobacillus ginsengisoli]MDQ0201212.1 hypothetical protein [Neobacillus ginsengisoli]
MKKLIMVLLIMFAFVLPSFAEAKGFSGGHSSSFSSHSYSTPSSGTYHSGYKSPSSNVKGFTSNSQAHTSYNQQPSRTKSFWTHAAAFGAGTFLGSMFHPFGGHYYGPNGYNGANGFSFFGLLVDVLVIVIIIRVIKAIFTRRRY